MKILLVNPPHENIIRESLPESVEVESSYFPPLGILYLAANARQVCDVEVEVVDCLADSVDGEEFKKILEKRQPDLVGISVMTHTWYDALACAKASKTILPRALVLMGGHHVSLYPRETLAFPEVDAVVMGEAEVVFRNLVQALKEKTPLSSVPGVATKENANDPAVFINQIVHDLDSLPLPARDLVRTEAYNSPLLKGNSVTSMGVTRGCPGKCVFCSMAGKKARLRTRSPQNVVAEMTQCVEKFGLEEISFYDDTFTAKKDFVIDVCHEIQRTGLSVHWEIRSRVDTINEKMLESLKRAGCERIFYGVETGSPKIQKRLRKNLDLDQVKKVFALTKKVGIETFGYFMIGCPDETRQDFEATLDFMTSLAMDYTQISIFTPYPGTAIYQEALETGFFSDDYWGRFAQNPDPNFHPRVWNQYFSDAELHGMMLEAYRKFYARPSYLWQRLLEVRSFAELRRKGKLGLKILSGK